MEIQVLKAKEVEIPMTPTRPALAEPEYITKLRQRFLSGDEVGPEDLRRLMVASAEGGGGNGNCNIC